MNQLFKKNSIQIPKNTSVLYCSKKKILTIIGPLKIKSTKINLELQLLNSSKVIYVTLNPLFKVSNTKKKKIAALRGTTIALIKQIILETSNIIYKKLKFVGVGYKVFYTENLDNKLLLFKLGFSHSIYYKIPETLNIFCLKNTKLFIYGASCQSVTQAAATIQSYKYPEPYKGKGILYENEKIKLKEGKKT
jgi:large subunit ribosomal protein L6